MRLLHTADWHIGKTLARHSRIDEARAAVGAVVAAAAEHEADAVLVCGDVFEHLAPSPEAERVVYDALLRFQEHRIPVVLLAGNHDHPQRWRAIESLLARVDVRVVPEVRGPRRGGIVEVPARDGSHSAQIAVLPWVSERRIVGAADLMGLAGRPSQAYAAEVARLLEALCAAFEPGVCHVLAAHLHVAGATPSGSERQLTMGDRYAIAPGAIPAAAQYVALGHVHRPQRVSGAAAPARYAGSLLQLDFGEAGQRKSVALVDLEPGGPARVRELPIDAGRALLDVRGSLDELERYREAAGDAFVRVFLACERPLPGLADQVREVLPNAIEVRLEYARDEPDGRRADLAALAPRELLQRYHRDRYGADAEAELLDLFDRLLDEVTAT